MYCKSYFWKLGHKFTDHKLHLSPITGLRRFKSFYGVSPDICSILWKMIDKYLPIPCEPKHLLWALNFLKQYNVEATGKAIFGVDEKTLRKYIWIMIDALADIDTVQIMIL